MKREPYTFPTFCDRHIKLLPDAELLAIYPGFTIEQIKAGLYTPATRDSDKDRKAAA